MGIELEKLEVSARSSIEAFCSRRAPLYVELDETATRH